ncbi:hypothetical protein IFO70_07950 [Phormidium tenue FACHB-886]|nr:hypothetical protein [Phormidium tenue FACHB-886]
MEDAIADQTNWNEQKVVSRDRQGLRKALERLSYQPVFIFPNASDRLLVTQMPTLVLVAAVSVMVLALLYIIRSKLFG